MLGRQSSILLKALLRVADDGQLAKENLNSHNACGAQSESDFNAIDDDDAPESRATSTAVPKNKPKPLNCPK